MKNLIKYEKINGYIYDKFVISFICKENPTNNRYKVNGKIYKDTLEESGFDKIISRENVLLNRKLK
jgi:hypothetical protein